MATPAEIRTWLRANGYTPGQRGRLHPDHLSVYNEAHEATGLVDDSHAERANDHGEYDLFRGPQESTSEPQPPSGHHIPSTPIRGPETMPQGPASGVDRVCVNCSRPIRQWNGSETKWNHPGSGFICNMPVDKSDPSRLVTYIAWPK